MVTLFASLATCAGNSPVTFPHKASDAGLWCFLWSVPERTVEKKTIEPPRIWDVIAPIMTYGNGTCICVIHQNGSAQQGLTLLHIRDQSRYMPANERCRYIVTTSLIGWVHTYTDPCTWINELLAWLTSWLRIISSACFVKRWVEYWPNALFSGSKLCQRSSPQLSWKNITWAS